MRKQDVHIKTSKLYFEKVFEPERTMMEKKLGIKLSQVRFTEILAKQRLGINCPKINIRKNNLRSLPKQFKRRTI